MISSRSLLMSMKSAFFRQTHKLTTKMNDDHRNKEAVWIGLEKPFFGIVFCCCRFNAASDRHNISYVANGTEPCRKKILLSVE